MGEEPSNQKGRARLVRLLTTGTTHPTPHFLLLPHTNSKMAMSDSEFAEWLAENAGGLTTKEEKIAKYNELIEQLSGPINENNVILAGMNSDLAAAETEEDKTRIQGLMADVTGGVAMFVGLVGHLQKAIEAAQ